MRPWNPANPMKSDVTYSFNQYLMQRVPGLKIR